MTVYRFDHQKSS